MTGLLHSLPPSNLYLILLITFYLSSSKLTKYKEAIKAKKTKVPHGSSTTTPPVASQRTHVQVLCNSAVATALIIASLYSQSPELSAILKAGVIGQYCAVTADTWSSELGILATESPYLITTFERVPAGTNGGVTKVGLLAGAAGSALISAIASFTYTRRALLHFIFFTLIGFSGTIIDSYLGAFVQASIADTEDGLILEPAGGEKVNNEVLVAMKDRIKLVSGEDIFSNNQVNIIMSTTTTLLCIGLYSLFF